MANMFRFCKPSVKPITLRNAKLKVTRNIEKQQEQDIGNNASPVEVLTYRAELAFECAIHIAYLARQVLEEENGIRDIDLHNEKVVKTLVYGNTDLSEYYQVYLALDESLRRVKQIDQKEDIIQRWPRGKPIRFYGKGDNSNLSVALAFSTWIYDLCLTYGAEQMGMDDSLVIKSSDRYTLKFYKLAMLRLLKELPDETKWSKTKIQEESECISSGIATEYDRYKADLNNQPKKPSGEAGNDLAKTESEDSRMGDNKDDSKKLRDIANIFNGWSSDAEKEKYKNNKAEAEKIIRNGLEKAADLMPLINTLRADYGLRDRDPELNNAVPHNAFHYLEVRHINLNKEQIERHVSLLVKALTGQEPLGFFQPFLALAKELNRWAGNLEQNTTPISSAKRRPLIQKEAERILGETPDIKDMPLENRIRSALKLQGFLDIKPKSLKDAVRNARKKLQKNS